MKTGSESIETTLGKRQILVVARMEDTRPPKWVVLGELGGGGRFPPKGNRKRRGRDVCFFLRPLRAFGMKIDPWMIAD